MIETKSEEKSPPNGIQIQQNGNASVTEFKSNKTEETTTESKRDQWGGQLEFLLACLGNAVGLGNCWRFPYLCYKNGGGAFLLPYVICCMVIGLPIFLIELGLGQYSAMGPGQLWANLAPIFKGVGLASIISSAIVATYYNLIIAWTVFYLFEAFFGGLWQYCDNYFNTPACHSIVNSSAASHISNQSVSSTEEFFNNHVLMKSDGIEQITSMNGKLALALLVSWIIVAAALIKGIQSSGKVVYFTSTFPYVILSLLLYRGWTLPGARDGLMFYLTPDWGRIWDIEVWRDASVQVFYSFGIGSGGMITYASYNRFHNPVNKHALLVGVGDFLTSIFCGAVVFTMIGYMAYELEKPIDQIVQSGSGLAFIVIPEGLAKMPLSIVWSVLFFAMLFLLGIDSQFAMVETVITYVFDFLRSKGLPVKKPLVVSLASLFWFLFGLILCTDSGIYIFHILDTYAAGIPCLVIGLIEIFCVTCLYGLDRFFANLFEMTHWRPRLLLKSVIVVLIAIVAPTVISLILYEEIFQGYHLTYGSYEYPSWATKIGWGVAGISLLAIPTYMVIGVVKNLILPERKLRDLFQATPKWNENKNKEMKIVNGQQKELTIVGVSEQKSIENEIQSSM